MLRKWGLKKLTLIAEMAAYVFLLSLLTFMVFMNIVAFARMVGWAEVRLSGETMSTPNTSSPAEEIRKRIRY